MTVEPSEPEYAVEYRMDGKWHWYVRDGVDSEPYETKREAVNELANYCRDNLDIPWHKVVLQYTPYPMFCFGNVIECVDKHSCTRARACND